eukprot:TRINITY_DN25738_c0_g1_i2.p1 TRINITY_DN25738_c0_g1~~TRINITY_DN25738_c0_g1_i2.p1  ORF type:complete len:284 (-),score=47.17 TRINITY_DN25738_c0_g1_i2:49-900(-)
MQRLDFFLVLAAQNYLGEGYNETTGAMLAYLEKAVYCGEHNFNRWDVGLSVTKGPRVNTSQLRFVSNSDTQAAAGVGRMIEPDGCFVAFRGTYGIVSSIIDADFLPVSFEEKKCPGCQVVDGFHRAYSSVAADIFQTLEDFDCQGRGLYLVGHSQGAASLTYLLFDALVQDYHVKHMYALESPRVGNSAFRKKLQSMLGKSDAWRVAHYQDIVVHLPPTSEHALREIYYTAQRGTHYKRCGVEDRDCSGQWCPWQWTTRDHSWYADLNPCNCDKQAEPGIQMI